MKGSSTLIAAQVAADMRARGIDVIDLSVGEPDFDTPEFIKQYAWEGLAKGLTKYTATAGLAEFRSAIESTGYTLEEIRDYVAAHRELRRPLQHLSGGDGTVGRAASFCRHVASLMTRDAEWKHTHARRGACATA